MDKNTIITAEDIRQVRPIANNVVDLKRIEPYISEAETLYLLPAIGAGLYEQFTSDSFILAMQDDVAFNVITDGGGEILLSLEGWNRILNGGYYACGSRPCDVNGKRYSAGLKAAVSYLAYARMLPNQAINVTAFGVVNKTTALSEPADERTIRRAADEARNIGLEYLGQTEDYLRCAGFIDGRKGVDSRYRKFKIIG
jgi:hypothetical protein